MGKGLLFTSREVKWHFTLAQSKGQLHLEVGLSAGQMKGAVSEARLNDTLAPPKCPVPAFLYVDFFFDSVFDFVASRNAAF